LTVGPAANDRDERRSGADELLKICHWMPIPPR
jgi:hypothetical protein